MATFRNFEVMLRQTLDECEYNYVILCMSCILSYFFFVVVIFDIIGFSRYDNGIILRPRFYFLVNLSNVF
jgi:hypothetical protein